MKRLGFTALWAMLFGGLGAVHAQQVSVLSESAFAQTFERMAMEIYPDATVTASATKIGVQRRNGSEASFYLANAFAKYRANPTQLEEIIRSHLTWPLEQARDRANLLPVIRPKSWVDATRNQLLAVAATEQQIARSLPLSLPIAEDLVLVFADDSEAHVRFLGADELEQFGIDSAEEARSTAIENLRAKLPQLKIEGRAGRYRLHFDGTYESSMLLVLDSSTWAGVDLKGDPMIALPSRDTVLFCGSEDLESVAVLRSYAKKIHESADHPISAHLYLWRDGELKIEN